MEQIGTHRVFWLNTAEGIAEFDAYRHTFVRENHLSIHEDRDTIPMNSYKRQRRTVPTGYAPDPIFHYFSSDKAVSDSLERWKIDPSTPTHTPHPWRSNSGMSREAALKEAESLRNHMKEYVDQVHARMDVAEQDSDYQFWAQTYAR